MMNINPTARGLSPAHAPTASLKFLDRYASTYTAQAPSTQGPPPVLQAPQPPIPTQGTPATWRARLPQKAQPSRDVPVRQAVALCDKVMFGQEDVKMRLALSIASQRDHVADRFYYFLQGPAGVGKTTLARTLGAIYGRPVLVIRCDTISCVEQLFGYGPNWKSPCIGQITEAIANCGVSNPILFFDEVDKISGERRDAVLNALNHFLSRETTRYRDAYLDQDVDTSKISFLLAGNSSDAFARLPWLESRMGAVLPLTGYNTEQLRQILADYIVPATKAA